METTSVLPGPVTSYETVFQMFVNFGTWILDKKLSGKQIGSLTVLIYFRAYVNSSPYFPLFFLCDPGEIWYRKLPVHAVEQLSFVKIGAVRTVLHLRTQVIFPLFLHFFRFG